MQANNPLVETFWHFFLASLPESGAQVPSTYQVWGFGDSPEMADSLGQLAKDGVKTATASLVWTYDQEDEAYPELGGYSVILDGAGRPLCIIQTTRLYVRPFSAVDEEQAFLEGEGDRTLAFWRQVHWAFFSRECEEIGREPDQEMPVLCERFRLVYP